MANATVERYEQLLAQDPSSDAFVDLAEALIQSGDFQRAIEVCSLGIQHHPDSVIGRVLRGKALLNLSRAAEAMEQFERATSIDRQNSRSYILVSEVLLQRGLYRSALPLLKKAAALQPNDPHIRQWLDETLRALARGPGAAPVFAPAPNGLSAASVAGAPEATSAQQPPVLNGPRAPEEEEAILEALEPEASAPAAGGLLDDVPEEPEPVPPTPQPEHKLSPRAAEEIAKQYESHLHEQLKRKHRAARKSFLGRHWRKLAVGTVVGGALLVGGVAFLNLRAAHRDQDLKAALTYAKKAIAQDTRRSYLTALQNLSLSTEIDDGNAEAWALAAYANAILYSDYGGGANSHAKAESALARPRVRTKYPGLTLAADYYLADAPARERLQSLALASTAAEPELLELAGKIRLANNDFKGAIDCLGRALKAAPGNVRALVAAGDYYRIAGDFATALKFYAGPAAQISPEHPARVVGAAEARLELDVDLQSALDELGKLPPADELPMALLPRKELVHGRLLSALGQTQKAVEKLSAGARTFPARAFEFSLALGEANQAIGRMEAAQRAFEAALRARPQSAEGKEAVGKVLIARDREREVLTRFSSDPQSRKVSLIRGMAFAKLEDWKRARAEFGNTQLNGKFPIETVIHLALADAAEGQADRAQVALEKTLSAAHQAKAEIRVALGKVYWQKGALGEARVQFEEAAKEPEDYEGNCSLGRLLLAFGSTNAAIPALEKALSRNSSHGEAYHALGRAYLEIGRSGDALKEFEAWWADNPSSELVQKDLGWALYHNGRLKDADAALSRAVAKNSSDPEAHRMRASVLFGLGSAKAAMTELQRANKLNPKDPETFCEIGRALARQGSPETAVKAFEAAKRENSASECARVGIYYARLPLYSRAGVKELEEIAHRDRTVWGRAFAQATLARMLVSTSPKEARLAAEEAVALGPFSADAHLALGLVYARQKEDPRAREELSRAVELEPAHGPARLAFADFLARDEQTGAKAIDEYRAFLRIGGNPKDEARVKHLLPNLKKKLASR